MFPAFKLRSLTGENCQSRRETNHTSQCITARSYVKGTFCAVFQHKHIFLVLMHHFTSLHLHNYSTAEYNYSASWIIRRNSKYSRPSGQVETGWGKSGCIKTTNYSNSSQHKPWNALKTIIVTRGSYQRVKQCPLYFKVTGRLLLEMGFSLLSDARGQL